MPNKRKLSKKPTAKEWTILLTNTALHKSTKGTIEIWDKSSDSLIDEINPKDIATIRRYLGCVK